MYNDELQLIPENIINDYLNKDFTSLVVCENCGLKEVKFIPYGYDETEHEVVYIGKCPICGNIMYVRD